MTIAFVVLAFACPVVALLFFILRREKRGGKDAWARTLARRVGGTFVPVVDADNPLIQFAIEKRAAEFWFGGRPDVDGPVAAVEVDVAGLSSGALKVARGSTPSILKRLLRMQDLEIGDAGFDRDYTIQANPGTLAREVFRVDDRNRLIWQLRRLGVAGAPFLELTQDTLTLGVVGNVRDHDVLLNVVEAATAFLKRIIDLHPTAGIDWKAVGRGLCPVCATSIDAPIASCGKCRTDHHEECWRWTGSCSRYACRERRWVRE